MIKVCLTGNIGSGKTIVSKVFETLGVPVFNADEEAKKLYSYPEFLKKVALLFGDDIIKSDSSLNREALASIVFSDKKKLEQLNSMVHPEVINQFVKWMNQQTHSYVIMESAIIFEAGLQDHFDKIILVAAPEKLRVERVMTRDGISKEKVLQRMKNQFSEELKRCKSFYVIENNEKQLITPQILKNTF
jgi:dephospho-CoA kinase